MSKRTSSAINGATKEIVGEPGMLILCHFGRREMGGERWQRDGEEKRMIGENYADCVQLQISRSRFWRMMMVTLA